MILVGDKTVNKQKVIALIRSIEKETELLSYDFELLQIYEAIIKTRSIKGAMAEVGVYKGATAKFIAELKENKPLYLFDTFTGLPNVEEIDKPRFFKGRLVASYQRLKEYLAEYSGVFIYKGVFPATSKPIKNINFSFVNIDVDIYSRTLDCLEFFYPRMNKKGIMILHDYQWVKCVKKAVDVFFVYKPEAVMKLRGSQGLIEKI